jgi:CelD/BcsL family acetyltransferase involved in cellulose biosynthesis
VRLETFNSLSQRWGEVLEKRPGATVFDLPEWQKAWWDHFGAGHELRLAAVSGEDGAVKMIAPFMCRGEKVSFLGSTDLVDYHDFICADGPSEACLDALIREISVSSSVDTLTLESLPDDSPTIERFKSAAEAAGWRVEVAQEDVAPRLELPATWDEYLGRLDKKDRHELRRKIRRLEGAGDVRHVELRAREDVETAADDFFRLHRMSMPEKKEFMTPERERFFRDVSARLADAGVTRLCFIELNGERVATSLSFVVGGVRYLYNSGYNPEHRTLAVGLLNHALAIRASIEQGLRVFDFMRGNEAYKYHLGGVDRKVFRLTATR